MGGIPGKNFIEFRFTVFRLNCFSSYGLDLSEWRQYCPDQSFVNPAGLHFSYLGHLIFPFIVDQVFKGLSLDIILVFLRRT
jgi:hypothetical protein